MLGRDCWPFVFLCFSRSRHNTLRAAALQTCTTGVVVVRRRGFSLVSLQSFVLHKPDSVSTQQVNPFGQVPTFTDGDLVLVRISLRQ